MATPCKQCITQASPVWHHIHRVEGALPRRKAKRTGISRTVGRQAGFPHFREGFYVPHPSARSTRRISASSSTPTSSLNRRARSTCGR